MTILWRQPKWLAGILLVLALLGHDSIMASAALTAPPPETHVHAPAHQPATIVVATPDDDHQPGHPNACGVAGTAAPASAHRLDRTDVGETASIASVDLNRTTSPWIGGADDPFWPPGTRRALLQVYRI
jgi:hypothetical protein